MSKPSTVTPAERNLHPRLARELKTVLAMIRLYCKVHHRGSDLCDECLELSEYAEHRLASCPFQENKTTCSKCTVHCYKPSMRKKIVEVMKFSGPRMLFHRPYLALAHLVDEKRSSNADTPLQPKNKKKNRP